MCFVKKAVALWRRLECLDFSDTGVFVLQTQLDASAGTFTSYKNGIASIGKSIFCQNRQRKMNYGPK